MNTDAQNQWLALLRKLEREKGNAVLATLEAKRQRPDLWAQWNGQRPASTQLKLFATDEPPTSQNAGERELGATNAKP